MRLSLILRRRRIPEEKTALQRETLARRLKDGALHRGQG